MNKQEILELNKFAASVLEDKLIKDIVAIDLEGISGLSDSFVIGTASNSNQLKAACDELLKKMKEKGFEALAVEGYGDETWILIDFHFLIVHLFSEDARAFYKLERLWADGKTILL